ncbi:MAG TPA: DinB family protein [Longimicrobium sp.]|jgi:uncharacterized damage-inducible protein DinB
MNEIRAIADQLARAHDGDPWYGDPTMTVLRGVTAEQASRRPIARAHSIWEIVLHMTSWQREVLRRLRTRVAREPEDGDWPAPPIPTDDAWREAMERLEAAHGELLAEVERFQADALGEILGEARDAPLGSGVSFYVLLHGIVQHNLAHTAQISLLKKDFTGD